MSCDRGMDDEDSVVIVGWMARTVSCDRGIGAEDSVM